MIMRVRQPSIGSTFDNINNDIRENKNVMFLRKEIDESIMFNCLPRELLLLFLKSMRQIS